jgi:protein arginine kinase activator
MKCDQCEQEATVHELRVVGGKKVERHLCERCARKQGIATQAQVAPVTPEMVQKYMQAVQQSQQGGAKAGAPGALVKADTCPNCGTGYLEFRQSGLLGCPECYKAFEGQLGPLLERAHEGGTHHSGKVPKRALGGRKGTAMASAQPNPAPSPAPSPAAIRAGKIASLKKQLDEAVKAEQYEKAAKIRDELRDLSEPAAGGAAEGKKPKAT